MSAQRMKAKLASSIVFMATLAACSERAKLPLPPSSTSGGNSGGAGGMGTSSGSGTSGSGGMGTGGENSGGSPPGCGDGTVDIGTMEECDGDNLNGNTCQTVGFDQGALSCNKKCKLDLQKCFDFEKCTNAVDDDKDGSVDCKDPECAEVCADSCGAKSVQAIALIGGSASLANGSTAGHANKLNASCTASGGTTSGAEVVYQIKAMFSGLLDVKLTSDSNLGISLRTDCAKASSEIACSDRSQGPLSVERIKIPIKEQDTVFVVVQGHSPSDAGTYTLGIMNRVVTCSDGFVDEPEECDDFNFDAGDGCSPSCKVESTEKEPNNTLAQAGSLTPSTPWYGAVSPAGDVDVIAVTTSNPKSSIVAKISDFDNGACNAGELDSYVEILDSKGATLAENDDMGASTCSMAKVVSLSPGVYYVRVQASSQASQPTFAYKLNVDVTHDICGDGAKTGAEQCDDGNMTPNDGCSPNCQFELTEKEPNGTAIQANAYVKNGQNEWHAAITPDSDVDVVSIDVPAQATLIANVVDYGTGACLSSAIVTRLEILDRDGTTVLSGSEFGVSYCASTSAAMLDAGKYYVRVKAGPLNPAGTTFSYGLDLTLQ